MILAPCFEVVWVLSCRRLDFYCSVQWLANNVLAVSDWLISYCIRQLPSHETLTGLAGSFPALFILSLSFVPFLSFFVFRSLPFFRIRFVVERGDGAVMSFSTVEVTKNLPPREANWTNDLVQRKISRSKKNYKKKLEIQTSYKRILAVWLVSRSKRRFFFIQN